MKHFEHIVNALYLSISKILLYLFLRKVCIYFYCSTVARETLSSHQAIPNKMTRKCLSSSTKLILASDRQLSNTPTHIYIYFYYSSSKWHNKTQWSIQRNESWLLVFIFLVYVHVLGGWGENSFSYKSFSEVFPFLLLTTVRK